MKISSETLSKVASIFNGKTPAKSDQRTEGHPVLKIKDISEDGLFKSSFQSFVDIAFAKRFDQKKIMTGDTLILNAAHNADYVGSKVYRAESHVEGSIATGEWTLVRADTDVLHPQYLHYWLVSGRTKHHIRQIVKGIHLYPKDVARLKIPLPPLEEQKRIAAILDKADAVRRKRKEAIALTEELLRSTFLDMFGDPVTNPKGWDKCKLSKLGCVITGNTPPRANPENYGDDIEWIKSDNITTPYHFLTYATEGLSSQGKKIARIVPTNSILVACIAGSRSSIGRAALADREVAFNQQINAIVPNPNVDPFFLYTQFFVAQHLVQAQSTDSMKGLVSKSKFSNIEFISPPEQKQREFGKWFSRFYSWSSSLRDGEQHTDNLFNSLLQKAFRGEL